MSERTSDIGRAVDWMIESISSRGRLSQPEAVEVIGRLFGPECLGRNAADNVVLARPLTELFRKRTTRTVAWDPGSLCWRALSAPVGRAPGGDPSVQARSRYADGRRASSP